MPPPLMMCMLMGAPGSASSRWINCWMTTLDRVRARVRVRVRVRVRAGVRVGLRAMARV